MTPAIEAIRRYWFKQGSPGAYVLVDGQFGSTGKGLLASLIAEAGRGYITHITTNAGPNSGHTGNYPGTDQLFMTQQVPCASVILKMAPYLNAGAIIDPDILNRETREFDLPAVMVHPCVAVIDGIAQMKDEDVVRRVAGTGKGIGPAIAHKVMRNRIPRLNLSQDGRIRYAVAEWNWNVATVFVETAQGFSLGINSERFYPKVTSRECTVMQAITDARIPAQMVRGVAMTLRTYPIRVGNTESDSGGCYPDQQEISWADIGVEPELTSVTKRVRRVFTWSRMQFCEAVAANRPDVMFINFMNYLRSGDEQNAMIDTIMEDYKAVTGAMCPVLLLGYGPKVTDIQI